MPKKKKLLHQPSEPVFSSPVSLQDLKNMFYGKLDGDVVEIIAEQYNGNLEAALETLLHINSTEESPTEQNIFKGIVSNAETLTTLETTENGVDFKLNSDRMETPPSMHSTSLLSAEAPEFFPSSISVPCSTQLSHFSINQEPIKVPSTAYFHSLVNDLGHALSSSIMENELKSDKKKETDLMQQQNYERWIEKPKSQRDCDSVNADDNETREKDFALKDVGPFLFDQPLPQRKKKSHSRNSDVMKQHVDQEITCTNTSFASPLHIANTKNGEQLSYLDMAKKPSLKCENRKIKKNKKTKIYENWDKKRDYISNLVKYGKVMVILRGCSGSGKSSLAQHIKLDQGMIFSSDDFFINDKGDYKFSLDRLKDAHDWNFSRVKNHLEAGIYNPIIIDNTNTEIWEMVPYVKICLKHNFRLELMEPETPWSFNPNVLYRKNKHGVQLESLKRAVARFDRNITATQLIDTCKKCDLPKSGASIESPKVDNDTTKTNGTCSSKVCDETAPKSHSTPFTKEESGYSAIITVDPVNTKLPKRLVDYDSDDYEDEEDQKSYISLLERNLEAELINTWEVNCEANKTQSSKSFNIMEIGKKTDDNLLVSNEWSFPPYPIDSKENLFQEAGTKCIKKDNSTITSGSDFSFVKGTLRINNLTYGQRVFLDNFLLIGSKARDIFISENDEINKTGLDKSSYVNNEVGEDAIILGGLLFLKECFPTCYQGDLEDILEHCQGDLEFAVDIVLSLGYDFNDSETEMDLFNFEKPLNVLHSKGIETEMVKGEHGKEKNIDNYLSEVPDSIIDDNITCDSQLNFTDLKPNKSFLAPDKMILSISNDLLNQLQEKFGRFPMNDEKHVPILEGLSLNLELDHISSRKIYDIITDRITSVQSEQILEEQKGHKDMSNSTDSQHFLQQNSEKLNFREIMKEQKLSDKLKIRQPMIDESMVPCQLHTLSSQLKLKKLTDMFEEIEEDILEEMFLSNNCGFESTVHSLKEAGFRIKNKKKNIQESSDDNQETEDNEELNYLLLRSEAFLHHRKRVELFEKAQKAFKSNIRPAAYYYSQLAHKEGEKVRNANKRASQMMFDSKHRELEKSNILDLHGLHVDEAIKLVKDVLNSRMNDLKQILKNTNSTLSQISKHQTQVTIVTGRGNGSRGGNAKIRPSVINYLRQHKFFFTEENSGVLEVFLKQSIS